MISHSSSKTHRSTNDILNDHFNQRPPPTAYSVQALKRFGVNRNNPVLKNAKKAVAPSTSQTKSKGLVASGINVIQHSSKPKVPVVKSQVETLPKPPNISTSNKIVEKSISESCTEASNLKSKPGTEKIRSKFSKNRVYYCYCFIVKCICIIR